MPGGDLLPLPTDESARALKARLASHGSWFYRFEFSNGVATEPSDAVSQAVHDARARLIFPLLDQMVGDRWSSQECIDLACHEGWFSAQLAARGAQRVLGIDLRSEHVKKANGIKDMAGLSAATFEQGDLFTLDTDALGSFDITFFLGVLYHVDSPVQALRVARALTKGVCVIETQVARAGPPLECLWGSGAARSGPGIAVVPADDVHVQGGRDVVLVPTLAALVDLLHAVGFRHVSVVAAPPDDFPQFADADRVVVFALA